VRVSLSTHASLWPFLHMLQRRTSSNPHSHFKGSIQNPSNKKVKVFN
jgi:hypothetical protein